ncbi:MAG: hypothetical protein Q9166_007749 [cf. Caloplaca sp. 2 TL-2023]
MATVFFPHDLLDVRGLLRQAHRNRKSTVLLDSFLEKAFAVIQQGLTSIAGQNRILSFEFSNATKSLLSSPTSDSTEEQMVFHDLAGWCSSSTSGRQGDRGNRTNIAIVGMSCRFPDADNVDAFWRLLEEGRDTCKRVPKDRFDVDTHYDPLGKKNNASHTPYGCFIEHPGLFDPRFFNMSPREATETDPMHRLALVTAYEALEMSGFVLNATPSTQQDRVGTFYGQTCDDWREVNAAQNIETYFISGGIGHLLLGGSAIILASGD